MTEKPTPRRHRGTVLVVDDEDYVRESIVTILEREGFTVHSAANAAQALARLDGLDAAILDLKMPEISGEDLLARIQEREPSLPVLVLTGHGSVTSAVACMQQGASDYLLKPADPEELLLTLDRVIRSSGHRRELSYLRHDGARAPLGDSRPWMEALRLAHVAAPSDTSVLLVGESGTGKEEVAKEIHRRSKRSQGPFVCVNCAAVPESLFESEFFGHRRGAFTGATSDRDGRFRVADGGTLLLDEIDALPALAQAKVLRVLQDGTFERLGDSKPTRVDVRILSASNRDLAAEVEAGRFRADLFYRINVLRIPLPPLRQRPGDVELLARAFLEEFAGRLGRPIERLSAEVVRAFDAYSWPGNVRELRNVIERGTLLERTRALTLESLPWEIASLVEEGSNVERDLEPTSGRGSSRFDDLNLRRQLANTERRLLLSALERSEGVRRDAATLLGIDPRNLAYYLRKHGLLEGDP